MPVKRRPAKRRLGPEAELRAWHELFSSGFDFFGDLEPVLGRVTDVEARALAVEPWQRLGASFLATWDGADAPWALSTLENPDVGEAPRRQVT